HGREASQVLVNAADRHGPIRIKKVMDNNQKQAAEHDAQVKHECCQPRKSKLLTRENKAEQRAEPADRHEDIWQGTPLRKIERCHRFGCLMRCHTIWSKPLFDWAANLRVGRAAPIGARGRTPRSPSGPRPEPAARTAPSYCALG